MPITTRKLTALALGLGLALTGATAASAHDRWDAHHPRRAEVNARLDHQAYRVAVERRDGQLSRGQAREIRTQDRGIRSQERFYASRHDGHITRAEQRRLNHEENRVSHEIGR